MNDSMKEYIRFKKQFQEQEKDSSSVLALYELADRLALLETPEAKSWACMPVPLLSSQS